MLFMDDKSLLEQNDERLKKYTFEKRVTDCITLRFTPFMQDQSVIGYRAEYVIPVTGFYHNPQVSAYELVMSFWSLDALRKYVNEAIEKIEDEMKGKHYANTDN